MKNETVSPKKRIWLMDEIRGFAVVCMVFYHAFYTFAVLFHFSLAYDLLMFFMPVEPLFAGLFILISGISSCLSRSNLIRGLKLLGVALAVTLVTGFMNSIIVFGILHFLSICMIFFGLCKKALEKIPFWPALILCIFLYLCTMQIDEGVLAFVIRLPQSLYQSDWLFMFGIHSGNFFSADYFPIFPWIFVFLAGTVLGRLAAQEKFPRFMYKNRIPPLSWCGRHALLLYIVHQPVIYVLAEIVTFLSK